MNVSFYQIDGIVHGHFYDVEQLMWYIQVLEFLKIQSNLDIRNLDIRKIRDIRNFLPLTNFLLHSKSQYKNFFEKVKYRYKKFFGKISYFWQNFPIFLVTKKIVYNKSGSGQLFSPFLN